MRKLFFVVGFLMPMVIHAQQGQGAGQSKASSANERSSIERERADAAGRMERAREGYERAGNEKGARDAAAARDRVNAAPSEKTIRQAEKDFNGGSNQKQPSSGATRKPN